MGNYQLATQSRGEIPRGIFYDDVMTQTCAKRLHGFKLLFICFDECQAIYVFLVSYKNLNNATCIHMIIAATTQKVAKHANCDSLYIIRELARKTKSPSGLYGEHKTSVNFTNAHLRSKEHGTGPQKHADHT